MDFCGWDVTGLMNNTLIAFEPVSTSNTFASPITIFMSFAPLSPRVLPDFKNAECMHRHVLVHNAHSLFDQIVSANNDWSILGKQQVHQSVILKSNRSYNGVDDGSRMHNTARTKRDSTADRCTCEDAINDRIQNSTAEHSTTQQSTVQHSRAQYNTAEHSTTQQYNTAQHSTGQRRPCLPAHTALPAPHCHICDL